MGYTRVSRDEQVDGLSLSAQERAVRAYCSLRKFKLLEVVCDPGVSAGKPLKKRKGGRRVLELLESRMAQGVVSLALDRIFRDVLDCLDTVRGWDARGIAMHLVEFAGQPIDTSSAVGSMFLLFSAGFAELWRRRTSEKVRQVMADKRAKGLWTGGQTPLGYKLGGDGKLVEIPTEQQALRMIHAMEAKGVKPAEIARRLNQTITPLRGRRWYINTVTRQMKSFRRTPRDRVGYGPAFHRRLQQLRPRVEAGEMDWSDVARMLTREGHEPLGTRFYAGSLSRIARGINGHEGDKERDARLAAERAAGLASKVREA